MTQGRVCVVGAGVAGLTAAKVLQADGFEVSVFEKEASLGGVWCESRSYPELRTNDPREFYAFSDHAYPSSADDFPTAAQVRAYLQSYAERFGIAERIRFGTEVVRAAPASGEERGESGWLVTVRDSAQPERLETLDFDFFVICNGVFSQPYRPEVEGTERFAGTAVHSSQFDPERAKGKRIIVVGSSKSGLDLASWAAREGRSCALVFRHANWMLPRYLLGRINVKWTNFSRFTEAFAPYCRRNKLEALLHGPGAPLVDAFWWGTTALLRRELAGAGPLIPEQRLPARAENLAVGTDVYRQVRRGEIRPLKATIRRFVGGRTVELNDGTQLEADLVIFATGYQQTVPFLEQDVRRRIERKQGFQLYRLILPPDVPQLGFVGYSSSFSCPITAEISAHWLSQCFRGELVLPSVEEMNREIERFRSWLVELMPRFEKGFFIGPFISHYLDDLLGDMKLPTSRTSNFLSETFLPNWPTRYRTLAQERERARTTASPVRSRFYFSGAHALGLVLLALSAWILWS